MKGMSSLVLAGLVVCAVAVLSMLGPPMYAADVCGPGGCPSGAPVLGRVVGGVAAVGERVVAVRRRWVDRERTVLRARVCRRCQ